MILDEDPATLIHECTSNFHYAPDRESLARILGSLSTLSDSRSLRLDSHVASVKKHTRRLQNLAQQHELNIASTNPMEHASEILRLDTVKFKIAKEASDAEIESERLEGECRRTEGILVDLDRATEHGRVKEGAGAGERQILKLKLYRSLGVDLERDGSGRYSQAVVRNTQRKTFASIVEIDPHDPMVIYPDRLWQNM